MAGWRPSQSRRNRKRQLCACRTFAAGPFIAGRDLDLKTDYNGVLAEPVAFATKAHVIWLGVGTAEPERMRDSIRKLHTSLTDAGIAHGYRNLRHGPRVADLAAQSERLRAKALPPEIDMTRGGLQLLAQGFAAIQCIGNPLAGYV